jgi:hypothetical protein
METWKFLRFRSQNCTLYSLEKLIEWKLKKSVADSKAFLSLYSLEKLIEWKRFLSFKFPYNFIVSLLAREIN